jgi:hypothetical protein
MAAAMLLVYDAYVYASKMIWWFHSSVYINWASFEVGNR